MRNAWMHSPLKAWLQSLPDTWKVLPSLFHFPHLPSLIELWGSDSPQQGYPSLQPPEIVFLFIYIFIYLFVMWGFYVITWSSTKTWSYCRSKVRQIHITCIFYLSFINRLISYVSNANFIALDHFLTNFQFIWVNSPLIIRLIVNFLPLHS